MPWNFPFWQVFRFLAPALMAGNVGLLKHASNVPQCALAIEALVRRAGFPRGSFQTLLIEASQVETVLADARVAAVTVTGSESAGRAVAAQAGWLIKKSVLELGGSDPFIVMPSADLDAAVAAAVAGAHASTAASPASPPSASSSTTRIYDEFESRFVAAMETSKSATPCAKTPRSAPSPPPRSSKNSNAQVQAALHAGARAAHRRRAHARHGKLLRAHRARRRSPHRAGLSRRDLRPRRNALPRSPISTRPSPSPTTRPSAWPPPSGPPAATSSSRFAAELQCGAVFFNAQVASDPRLPFGGVKRSGYGRELSAAGMREFLNAKTVVIAEPEPTP